MKFTSDIDIDFADRDQILDKIDYISASIRLKDGSLKKHNTGVYPTYIPYDPINNFSSLDYKEAEDRGYIKLDFLNVWVYKLVKDEDDLISLMKDPDYTKLLDRDFFSKLVHIGNHYDSLIQMPEPIDNIHKLAMFLALIRPGKKHLIGLPWTEVEKTIWDVSTEQYSFKKAHGLAYGHLIIVHMNLLSQGRGELLVDMA
jgi:hypothetical protein